jgi:hypothetical protein
MQYDLPHVTISGGSDLLQLPGMLDFEETEKSENRTVNFLQLFRSIFSFPPTPPPFPYTGFHNENPLY